MKLKSLIILISVSLSFQCFGQVLPNEIRLRLENYLEISGSEDIDVADLIISLQEYIESPIPINKASYETLEELQILTDFQIQNLINYRDQRGDLIAIEELQAVPGFDLATIMAISSFVTVGDSEKFRYPLHKMAMEGKNELFLKWRRTMETQKGYIKRDDGTTPFAGDPNRLFVRYKHNYENRLRYGFTLEKDEGEDFFGSTNPSGFDYFTAHVYLKDYSTFLKDIVVGDYSISMGQGLILHNEFGGGKSAFVTDIKKGGRAIRPYNSVNENSFYRGAAATIRPIKQLEWTSFISYKAIDATIQNLDTLNNIPDNEVLEFSSIRLGGFHRTASEIRNEKVIQLLNLGSVLKWKGRQYNIGLNFLHTRLDGNFLPNSNLYRKFQQFDNNITNVSIDYSYRWRNLHFFGESASNPDIGSFANVHGLLIGLDKTVNAAVLYRNYNRDYLVLESNAFGESANGFNEKGVYLGLEFRPVYAWKFVFYGDIYQFPWLKFQVDRPSQGKEYLARIDYIKKRKLNIYLQYTFETKEDNFALNEFNIQNLEYINRHRVRFQISQKLSKTLELRNRFEMAQFSHGGEQSRGYLFYQDVIFKPQSSKFSCSARFALFDTDDSRSAIYAYENDILYEFFIPAYSNKGTRYYFNIRYDATRNLTMEYRFSRSYFDNLEKISTGNAQIDGNVRTQMKAQILFKF